MGSATQTKRPPATRSIARRERRAEKDADGPYSAALAVLCGALLPVPKRWSI
jgi:hypothetical protein